MGSDLSLWLWIIALALAVCHQSWRIGQTEGALEVQRDICRALALEMARNRWMTEQALMNYLPHEIALTRRDLDAIGDDFEEALKEDAILAEEQVQRQDKGKEWDQG